MSGGFRQDEVDALLASVRSGEHEERRDSIRRQRQIRPYDFSRPIKVDRDQMRDLNRLHTSFCRGAAGQMSSELRSLVDMRVIHGEQGPWRELYDSFPGPAVYGIVKAASTGRPIVLAAETTALSLVIDVMLGGPGGVRANRKDFTDIDLALIQRIFTGWTQQLETQWQRVGDESLSLLGLETEHFAANVVPPSEPTVSFTIELRLGSASATVGLLCPYGSVSVLLDRLSRGEYRSGTRAEDAVSTGEVLPAVEAQVRAIVARRQLTLDAASRIGPGDVIELPDGWQSQVELRAADEPLYRGRPGRVGNRRAMEIIDAWVVDEASDTPRS